MSLISRIRESRCFARLRDSNKLGLVEGASETPVTLAPSSASHALKPAAFETGMTSYEDATSTVSLQ